MTRMFNNYIGKAGQFFAMSEFLMRGWNVAVPEVDRGDDIFVVQDSDGLLRRVQVKTAQASRTANGYVAKFSIPTRQLLSAITPEIQYVLLVRLPAQWCDMLIIDRPTLAAELNFTETMGDGKTTVSVSVKRQNNILLCAGRDLTRFNWNFDRFPTIRH